MILAQLPSEVETIWWVTLALGLVVAIVVVVLLQVLLNSVKQVERSVILLWETATSVARNTATSWMLERTAISLEEVKREAQQHDRVMEERGGGS